MDRQTYLLAVPMTEGEADALLKAAARMGQDIGTFLSGIITDMHNGLGDEGDLINAYLRRAEPVDADRSFVAFCLAWGHDVDELESLNEAIRDHEEEAAVIREDLARGAFPDDHGWLPGTTPEDARTELAFQEDWAKELEEDKAELWGSYTRQAGQGAMTEAEALEEAAAFQREADAFKKEQATAGAREILEKQSH